MANPSTVTVTTVLLLWWRQWPRSATRGWEAQSNWYAHLPLRSSYTCFPDMRSNHPCLNFVVHAHFLCTSVYLLNLLYFYSTLFIVFLPFFSQTSSRVIILCTLYKKTDIFKQHRYQCWYSTCDTGPVFIWYWIDTKSCNITHH